MRSSESRPDAHEKPGRFLHRFGPYHLNLEERTLLLAGKPVALSPKAVDALILLVGRSGHVVSKEELIEALWPDTIVEENNLSQCISMLRKALGERRGAVRYIETIPKRGYRFTSGSADETEKFLAILPFAASGEEETSAGLCAGISDALIAKLTNFGQFNLRPTGHLRPQPDPIIAGQELGADQVLTGKVHTSGGRIHVLIELVEVSGERLLWAQHFDQQAASQPRIEDRLSEKIATWLITKLGPTTGQRDHDSMDHSEAYEDFFRGRYYHNKLTLEGLRAALASFERAIEANPRYAHAYAGLSDCYASLASEELLSPKEAFPKAASAALKALSIDPSLSEGHGALARVRGSYELDFSAAEKEFKLAIELDPRNAKAHRWYACYLAFSGRRDEAVRMMSKAVDCDPTSLITHSRMGLIYYLVGRYSESIRHCRETLKLDPRMPMAHLCLGLSLLQEGACKESVLSLRRLVRLGESPFHLAALGHALGFSGQREECLAVIERLKSLTSKRYVSAYHFAVTHLSLGDTDAAFRSLFDAIDDRTVFLAWREVEPRLNPLRSDPRFKEFLKAVNKRIQRAAGPSSQR